MALPCISTFFTKTSRKPPIGRSPFKPDVIQLTPIQKNFTTVMLWGQVGSDGVSLQNSGIKSVSRDGVGSYMVVFTLQREDDNFIISRFADDHQNDSQSGPYSRITEQSDSGFVIRWMDRSGTAQDTNFIFGVYA